LIDWSKYPLLATIDSPADLKKLQIDKLETLVGEMREFMIEVVSETGGHLGSNLGSVEIITAMHYVYNSPVDKMVFDVGAQAYPHKIITGRREIFHTNRQYGGISGFPFREESEYDNFTVGHSSTSISAALGMAAARDYKNENYKVIALIGDGGMTGGMAFEGLNNTGASKADMTVILNDNHMAISPTSGALSQYMSAIRTDTRFEKLKDGMWNLTTRLPKGSKFQKALRGFDAGLQAMLVPGLWFSRLGFRYVGPVDGHDLPELIKLFEWLKGISGPVLVHLRTEKGKGYAPAENADNHLHGVSKFNLQTGPVTKKNGKQTFSGHFSDELLKHAKRNEKIIAITPAMSEGSELLKFQEQLPDRCIDVGIAEQHAVTYAAGLATQGMIPVTLIYSSFLQRAYDQIIHDVALPNLHVIFGIDRAGLVGDDGPTHHGAFDISFLRHIPNMTVLVPRDQYQLRLMLRTAINEIDGPVAIRFPRGVPLKIHKLLEESPVVHIAELLRDGSDGLIISAGILLASCLKAATELSESSGLNLAVLDIRSIKPLDTEYLQEMALRFPRWLSVEENALMGGIGSALLEFIGDSNCNVTIKRLGLPDRFVTHGDRLNLLKEIGLDDDSIKESIVEYFSKNPNRSIKEPD